MSIQKPLLSECLSKTYYDLHGELYSSYTELKSVVYKKIKLNESNSHDVLEKYHTLVGKCIGIERKIFNEFTLCLRRSSENLEKKKQYNYAIYYFAPKLGIQSIADLKASINSRLYDLDERGIWFYCCDSEKEPALRSGSINRNDPHQPYLEDIVD